MPGLIPPLLLLLFGAWCGTFAWGPSSWASAAAAFSLLGLLALAGFPWRDPLRLGDGGRFLPAALWIAAAGSAWASPVPRAGWAFLILLPAFLGLPAVVERCWRREADRRLGLRGVALAVIAVALWALVDWLALGSPRPAMPLGHHNLLAAWLVILLPLAVAPAREAGPWRFAGWMAAALGGGTVLATRSLAACAALAVEILLAAYASRGRSRRRGGWALLLAVMVAAAALQLPRAMAIVTGKDPSARARTSYLAAGVEGFTARPILGWGPGSTPWTAAAFLDPVPGVSPWGESVGDLHSLPVQIGYELGVTGLLLAAGLALLFFARRLGERQEGRDPALLMGGLLGLAGGLVAATGSAALNVTALPLAAAVAAGAALAGSRGRTLSGSTLPARVYALAALALLGPLEVARWHYDRARIADGQGRAKEAREEVATAARIDPLFPLYSMRLALLRGRDPREGDAAAGQALKAAELSRGVPALWLVAGILGRSSHAPWAGEALDVACRLDPLEPFSPFEAMLANRGRPEAPAYGAQALLAEPRLATAASWESKDGLYARTLEAVRTWPDVDAGWKEAFLAAGSPVKVRSGRLDWLELTLDTEQRETFSLTAFRRRPWQTRWGLLKVHRDAWERFAVPPAAASSGTSPRFLDGSPCRKRSLSGQSLLTH
ncbi:MAG: O-antigen ligase family protein [Thermoanaerobaculia bacterium]